MCGIVGYVGPRVATEFLVEGLRRLEYRGYDSAGVATMPQTGEFSVVRTVGRIEVLAEQVAANPLNGQLGIGHTRWATHGAPTEINAHPHAGGDQEVIVVHNGVIENYAAIKQRLAKNGYRFQSATDSEVLAHLVADCLRGLSSDDFHSAEDRLLAAVNAALAQVRGTYGLVIMFRDHPGLMIACRLGSPLVVGVGTDEHFVASDASPLVGFTDKIVYLADHQLAVVTADKLRVTHRDQGHVAHNVQTLEMESNQVELNGYPHYMLKEIFEHSRRSATRTSSRRRRRLRRTVVSWASASRP